MPRGDLSIQEPIPALCAYQIFFIRQDVVDAVMLSDHCFWPNCTCWVFKLQEHKICRDTHTLLNGGMVDNILRKVNVESITEPHVNSLRSSLCQAREQGLERGILSYSARTIAGYAPMVPLRMSMYSCTSRVNIR